MEESGKVWQFIMEREIESPERFQAIQSYRAAMAVLRQQVHYVEHLRDSGMIDEAEQEMLLKSVECLFIASTLQTHVLALIHVFQMLTASLGYHAMMLPY